MLKLEEKKKRKKRRKKTEIAIYLADRDRYKGRPPLVAPGTAKDVSQDDFTSTEKISDETAAVVRCAAGCPVCCHGE